MTTLSKGPLSAVRILVGRAKHQAGALSANLRELGAEVIEIPFIEIRPPQSYEPLDDALRKIRSYDWLILTSVNGVNAVWERLNEVKVGNSDFDHLKIAAIGPATRKAVEKRGLKVDVVPRQYVAESVVESLRDKVAGANVLLARAKVARDVIPKELRKLGAAVDVIEAYETMVPAKSRLELEVLLKNLERRPDVIMFTSSSSVRNFLGLLPEGKKRELLDGVRFASIGPVTSATLRDLGLKVHIEASEFTIPGLVRAVVQNR